MDTVWNSSEALAQAAHAAGVAWASKHPRLAKQTPRVRQQATRTVSQLSKTLGGTQRETVRFAKLAFVNGAQGGGSYPAAMNPRRKKPSDKLRDMETPMVLGYELDRETLTPVRQALDVNAPSDYGHDPLGPDPVTGEFMFRMVPSGDIVNDDERKRRMDKRPGYRRNGFLDPTGPKLYRSFHGKPSRKITTVKQTYLVRDDYAKLGNLQSIKVALLNGKRIEIEFPDKEAHDAVMLCSSPDGKQLYFIGGDQSIDLRQIGMASGKWFRDLMVLGVAEEVTYRTRKGFDSFQLIDYYHGLGEDTGEKPYLLYDTINRELMVAGGQYKVKPEGIVN